MAKKPHQSSVSDTGSFYQKCKKKVNPRETFAYMPFYCEENVWQLSQHPEFQGKAGWAVFISNPARKCPMWHVHQEERSGHPVIWDYHVVLLTQSPSWQFWDFDTRLGFPVSPQSYLNYSFKGKILKELMPRFKLVEISFFRNNFSSDRSHMLGLQGEWVREPPLWPPIANGKPSNLLQFSDMDNPYGGEVYSLEALQLFLGITTHESTS